MQKHKWFEKPTHCTYEIDFNDSHIIKEIRDRLQ